jgi:hypothetical protein
MIGVFVMFRYGDHFDERAVRKIAETARARFEGMRRLHSKAFTLNCEKREAAKAFFTHELLERVAGSLRCAPRHRARADRDARGEYRGVTRSSHDAQLSRCGSCC